MFTVWVMDARHVTPPDRASYYLGVLAILPVMAETVRLWGVDRLLSGGRQVPLIAPILYGAAFLGQQTLLGAFAIDGAVAIAGFGSVTGAFIIQFLCDLIFSIAVTVLGVTLRRAGKAFWLTLSVMIVAHVLQTFFVAGPIAIYVQWVLRDVWLLHAPKLHAMTAYWIVSNSLAAAAWIGICFRVRRKYSPILTRQETNAAG